MSSAIKIISDSTCDLSKELIERYRIRILPLHIILGDTEYEDGVNISPDEIYAWSDEKKETPKTSAPAMNDVLALFKDTLSECDHIIAFSISDSMSMSGNILRMAAAELDAEDRIHVVNSANLSTGIGHLVIVAAEMASAGKEVEEILKTIEDIKPRVRASFVVEKLTFLHRGGRCSGLAAMAGSVLSLHPKIVVADGAMHPDKKYKGKMQRAVMSYVKDMEDSLRKASPSRVFITHSGFDEDLLNQVREYLESLERFEEILITRAGGVISSHCGPGTLGVLFIEGAE